MILATNSVPARAAGTPFVGSAFRKERSSGLDLAQIMGSWSKATAGTGLTNRSSRARFAASCELCSFSLAQGRKSARLNSGVRCLQAMSTKRVNLSSGAWIGFRLADARFSLSDSATASDEIDIQVRKPLPAIVLGAIVERLDKSQDGNLIQSIAPAWESICRLLRQSPNDN